MIKAKEGDDKIVTLTASEAATLVALMLNHKQIAETGGIPSMVEDKDDFDAHVDGLIQKLIM